MADPNQNNFDETPDPNATATITLAEGGAISSAISQQQSDLNLQGLFDPAPTNQQSVTSDNTVPSTAPDSASSGSVNLQVASRTDDMILNNCLNGYIDVIYNISLSLVSSRGATSIRTGGIEDTNSITSDDYIVFASTADAATDITESNDGNNLDYYNIQGLSFTSFLGHVPQNPMVAVTWDGKMKMFEPYGFQFREDIDAMARKMGYPSPLSPIDYVYRLEIWFSGYDPITGTWEPQIAIPCPLPNSSGNTLRSIVYFLCITTAEAKINPSGTMYELSFQTFSHYATRPENIIMHKDNIGKGGTHIDGTAGQSFGQFLKQLAQRLHDQVDNDTQHYLDITYKFTGLKALLDAKFITNVNMDFSTGVSFNAGDGSHAVSANAMDIYTLIHNVMINLDLVRQLMLREDDPNFVEPGTFWNIRTKISQADSPNSDINSNTKYTFEYIFEPVQSYRSRIAEMKQYNQQTYTSSMQQRVNRMLQYGMLIRWYDYYFTSDNSEVVDFQFKFKNFYYQQVPYPGNEVTMRGHGHGTADLNKTDGVSGDTLQNNASGSQKTRDVVTPNLTFTPSTDSGGASLSSLLNIAASPVSENAPSDSTNYGNIHQHRHRGPAVYTAGDSTADAYATKALAQRDQYLRWDMVTADMTVRFDPQWLINPYMAGSDFTPVVPTESSQDGTFVYAHVDRMLYLNAFAPNQKAFMNPDPSVFNIKQTPIIGGFYQVLYVVSEFDGGRFLQKLNLMKYDHLNYFSQTGTGDTGIQQSDQTFSANSGFSDIPADPSASASLLG